MVNSVCLASFTNNPVSVPYKSVRRSMGDLGEEAAAVYLESRGFRVIEKNWKAYRANELDVIFLTPCNTHVILEVKTRAFGSDVYLDFDVCLQAISKSKQINLIKAANLFKRDTNRLGKYRFDVLAVSIASYWIDDRSGKKLLWTDPDSVNLLHVEEAFRPGG